MTEIQAFAREFLRDPLHVAALFPSFAPLCRQAAAPLPETATRWCSTSAPAPARSPT